MRVVPEIESEMEGRVADLGYELVEVVWGGSGQRPLLKLRIDRSDSGPGSGVTVNDCAAVSRGLEAWLDAHEALSRRYVLEVSSPGLDRPLVRQRDFERFRGERVAVTGHRVLLGRSKRLEGELVGLQGEGSESEVVLLRMADGEEVDVPRSDIRRVNLLFEWK